MSKAVNKIPKRGEIWLIDYSFKPKKGKEKELETKSKIINKIRPSLVVSNNPQNECDVEIIVAPLSSKKLERGQRGGRNQLSQIDLMIGLIVICAGKS